EEEARQKDWATSFVLLKRDLVELDRFSSFVQEVARTVSLPNGTRGISSLIEKAIISHSSRYGIKQGKTVPLITYEKAKRGLVDFCSQNFITAPFQTVLRGLYGAHLESDQVQVDRLAQWFGGSDGNLKLIQKYGQNAEPIQVKPIGPNLADE